MKHHMKNALPSEPKYKVWISHNRYSHSLPSAVSLSANLVAFDMDKLSKELKSKIFGKIEIVELTRAEMQEIYEAKNGYIRSVGDTMMRNIFGKTNRI